MNYVHLRAFHAVAGQRSFTRAAKLLHVSQPTISDHIKSLESRYGVDLITRNRRDLSLTDIGKDLFEITKRQADLETEAEQLLTRAHGRITGVLRISADSPYLITPLMNPFNKLYPEVKLSLEFGNSQHVVEQLVKRESDIGVLAENTDDPRLECMLFRVDRLVAFVDRRHEWAAKNSIRFNDLATQTLVLREKGSTTLKVFEATMKEKATIPPKTLEIGSREGVKEAVAAGLGVGIISETEFAQDSRLRPIRIQDANLQVNEYIACLATTRANPIIDAFFQLADSRKEL